MWYFYVLQSQKDSNYFYKGSTGNLKERFKLHNNGKVQSTNSRRPWKLVYYEAYLTEKAARAREASVKRVVQFPPLFLSELRNLLTHFEAIYNALLDSHYSTFRQTMNIIG